MPTAFPEVAPVATTNRTESKDRLASCRTATQPTGMELLVGVPMVFIGFATVVWGMVILFQGGKEAVAGVFVAGLGLPVFGIGLYLALNKVLGNQHAYVVTADGIEYVTKKSSKKMLWSDINKLHMLEFYPHRFADMMMVVNIEPKSGKPLRFDTGYEGDPVKVLEYLTTHCDYMVRNPRGFTRSTS